MDLRMFSTYDFSDELSRRKVKIRLDIGQPDIDPNPKILEYLRSSLNEMGYGSSKGLEELREKVAAVHGVSKDQVAVAAGSKHAIAALVQGARMVSIIAPYWAGYVGTIRYFGADVEIAETSIEDHWQPRNWRPNGDVVILNYPNNPTGIVPERDFIEEVVDDSKRRGALVLSDEVYRDIVFGSKKYTILDYMPKRFAMVQSYSKTFSMPGLRLGYVIGDTETVKKVTSFVRATITSVPIFSQRAAAKALDLLNEEKERITKIYSARLKLFLKLIDRSLFRFLEPDGSFYVFVKLPDINGTEFAYKMMEKDVGIFPGEAYGPRYADYIRISLTCDERLLEEGIRKINETVENWR
ncbi:MAG: pyridoxal phosphate-dependent aminotransferase [Nitrososphaeria archaeon]